MSRILTLALLLSACTTEPAPTTIDTGTSDSGSSDDTDTDEADTGTDTDSETDSGFDVCNSPLECDDGLSCTLNDCVGNVCVTEPISECAWPAEPLTSVQNATEIAGPVWDNDMYRDLSGAVWNPNTNMLWVVRNNGPSKVWAVSEDGFGGYEIAKKAGKKGEWEDFGDAEAITLADLSEPEVLYILAEGQEHIQEYDLSTYGTKVLKNDWNIQPHTPVDGGLGAEGMTFVPDSVLAEHNFVDPSGNPIQSSGGMGGLMFVGHQNGGRIYVFDLNRTNASFTFVGEYETSHDETAALELDRTTGRLYIGHGAGHNKLEVARLSSKPGAVHRRFDTERVHDGPGKNTFGGDNYEGFAITPRTDCTSPTRRAFMTVDGGKAWSLYIFNDYPCDL